MYGMERTETEEIVKRIRRFRAKVDKESLEWLVKEGMKHRPGTVDKLSFDQFVEDTRANYENRQVTRLRRVLKKRYKVAGPKMAAAPMNITTPVAELQAQAYRQEPDRWAEFLVGQGNINPLAPKVRSSPNHRRRAETYVDAIRRSNLDIVMPEAERRKTLVGSVLVKGRFASSHAKHGREAGTEFTLFWPSQFFVIPNAAAPSKLWAAHALGLELASVGGDRRFEIWTQDDVVENPLEEGADERRPGWWFQRVTSKGKVELAARPFELEDIPGFLMLDRPNSECIIPDGDRDLLIHQDERNVMFSDHLYKAAMDGHRQIVIAGDDEKKRRAFGPGVALSLRNPSARVTTIPSDYDNTRLEGMQTADQMMARGKRIAPYSFWTKGGNPESGVAMEIRNAESDVKRLESIALLEETEREVGRLVARLEDKWGPSPVTIDGPDVSYRTRFHRPRKIEDPLQKQQRLKQDRDDGIISPARYAVEIGYFADEETAERDGGLSRKPKSKAPPPPFGAPPREEAPEDEEPADDGAEAS